MKNKKLKLALIYLAVTLVALLVYYVTLPPINPQSYGFWVFVTFLIAIYLAPITLNFTFDKGAFRGGKISINEKTVKVHCKKIMLFALVPVAVILIGTIGSSTLFNARKYADVITVKEAVFQEDMPDVQGDVTHIALMDTASATILGRRTLGELSDVVSQYEISDTYTQINYLRTPQKVANLEYADFFKWIGNRGKGIPGYVMVDPVNNNAKYVKLDKPMKYVQSGFFGDDLMRKLRFSYPTKILGEPKFEISDDNNPVYIVPCYKPRVFMFGAEDVNEVIIFDPCTGDSKLYALTETPAWVDIVYDGYLASEKYNWKGMLSGGYFNSIIGNRGCKQTTDDFGYVVLEDDVWYYTGVTSVTSDESNIAFILSNARTGEYKYYPVIGAEEHSAMGAAEGEVQEKGYDASFPVLINVSGEPTYIMVLKDANGLVKLFALVNVENYSIVATGETQQKAMAEYKKLLNETGVITDSSTPSDLKQTITVEDIKTLVIDGNSVCYIKTTIEEKQVFFKIIVTNDNLALATFLSVGDSITVTYENTETDNLYKVICIE